MNLPFKPQLLPDEHMLSGVARMLLLVGYKNLQDAQMKLFSRSVPLSNSVLVHSAMEFYLKDATTKPDRQKLILRHSLLGYYSHGLPYKVVKAALNNEMRDATTPRIPQLTKLKFAGVWRYCPVCAESDLLQYGMPYWRTSHQIPSSITCNHHPEIFLVSGCENCGSSITDLIEQPLPVVGSCAKCSATLEAKIFNHNEVTKWVQTQGLKLLYEADDLIRLRFGHPMKYGVSLMASVKGISGWERIDEAENSFDAWLRINDLGIYFTPDVMESNDRVKRLYSAIRYAETVPPVCHLLAYQFLGLSDFNQLVLQDDHIPSVVTV
ncbi:TniQ family protein [Rheinheimera muenzenbergensis]|uniref:TniQ family protein n=1 Tax=Rheinheimera muenzenbergensis TaxID=1193628 RepID=A0ABU8C282_9GAMM